MEITKPSLTEISTKFHIRHSLKEVRAFKDNYITIIINVLFLLFFILLVGGLLLYKYKGKLTPQEKDIKLRKEKMYLCQKMQQYAHDKQKKSQQMITNLPVL
jgi:hypothetical protein